MAIENQDNHIGIVVRRLRRERGLSQTELGEALEVTTNTISAIELGNQKPRGGLLKKIADYFGYPVIAFEQNFEVPNEGKDNKDAESATTTVVTIGDAEIPIQARYRPDYYHFIQTLVKQEILTAEEVSRIASIADREHKMGELVTYFTKKA